MTLGVSNTALAVALVLFGALVSVAALKLVSYTCRTRGTDDSDSDSDSDDDHDSPTSTADAISSSDSEKVALIAQEQRRMQRTAQSSAAPAFPSLRALLALPGAVVESNLLPPRRKLCAPKRFHKPHFHPLLDETAQWWAAQQQQQQAVVSWDVETLLSAPQAATVNAVDTSLLHQGHTRCSEAPLPSPLPSAALDDVTEVSLLLVE